jgi:thermitase
MEDALIYALGKNIVICASAGNNGDTNFNYPAAFPECIAVAATDRNDNRAGFSTYGDWVDVAAPGVDILSTLPGNGYAGESGTSMACPIVAGLAGLIRGLWPQGTNAQVRAQIENNCDPVGDFVIHGRVNALKSIPLLVTSDPISFTVQTVELFEGVKAYNTVNQARASDNTYFAISSRRYARLGHVASMKAVFVSTKAPNTLISPKLKIEGSGANYVTGSAQAWDFVNSKWVYLGAWPLTGGDSNKEFVLPAPHTRFFDATRRCVVLFRGVMPESTWRPPVQFALRADLLRLDARVPR